MTMHLVNLFALAACIAVPQAVGLVSAWATAAGVKTWHAGLRKPSFNPPNSVFGPVWSALYLLMGISLFLIWRSPAGQERQDALIAFGIQLALNFAWSFIFFRFRQIALALAEILVLWIAILGMILLFREVDAVAAYLQIPYLLWVGFATFLNASIWKLNQPRWKGAE